MDLQAIQSIDLRLASVLPAGSLFAVGGRVRDELRAVLEKKPIEFKDLDYVVVGLPLEEVTERFQTIGRTDVVGASFSVVKCTFAGITVDVALPRREYSTGVGHRDFHIESGPSVSLEDDLARRDFRMNMLARRLPGGDLVDPYGGEADIRARRIELLRPEAFVEDPLRMLRAAQFAARFEYEIAPATFAAMIASADLITSVSSERIRDEILKLLSARLPSVGIELLRESGLLAHIFPELLEGRGVDQNEWHAHDVYRHNLETLDAAPADDVTVRLAALLHDVGKPRTKNGPHFYRHEHVGTEMAEDMLQRLRLPSETIKVVSSLVREHMYTANPDATPATLRRFVRRVGLENLHRQFTLRHADIAGSGLPKRDDSNERFEARVSEIVEQKSAFSIKDLDIRGGDVVGALVEAGLLPSSSHGGPLVGKLLQVLFEQVTDEPSRNERRQLLKLLHQEILKSSTGNIGVKHQDSGDPGRRSP
ncbi:MAG TPA: HD domain-containing protein [Candidatus Baltobacteraceae bacterium]|jgi:putative nucleotidyltransferase with HDIG domain|nr:HD domain-containing protein [Candidatus Baltobacteraceae bacterium]